MFVRVILATLLVATASRGAAQSRQPLSSADVAEIVVLEKIEAVLADGVERHQLECVGEFFTAT